MTGHPDEAAIRRAQEASLRSMSTLFGGMGSPFGATVARDLKATADRMKWAGERLPVPARQSGASDSVRASIFETVQPRSAA